MKTLELVTLAPIAPSNKSSLSIYQSKRIIDDLQNSLEQENLEADSSLLFTNRQVFTGMILDARYFDEESKIKGQLLCKNGEDDERPIFSFIVLKQNENGEPLQIIYRWSRKTSSEAPRGAGPYVTEEQHIYQGEMKLKRKHGPGEYIIIKKYSNASEKQIRYKGTWNYDIFHYGTVEDESGLVRQTKNTAISFKSKSNLKGKLQKNGTIKVIAAEMDKKKSSKGLNISNCDESILSIKDAFAKNASKRSIVTIRE